MKVLYFSWLRDKIGTGAEEINPPAAVTDVGGLVDWLRGQGDNYAQAFEDVSVVRVALNQVHVSFSSGVKAGDEVAFFPPMTGG